MESRNRPDSRVTLGMRRSGSRASAVGDARSRWASPPQRHAAQLKSQPGRLANGGSEYLTTGCHLTAPSRHRGPPPRAPKSGRTSTALSGARGPAPSSRRCAHRGKRRLAVAIVARVQGRTWVPTELRPSAHRVTSSPWCLPCRRGTARRASSGRWAGPAGAF